ncbi:hypothetical protein ACFL51_02275 [Myxococcota bacterium]
MVIHFLRGLSRQTLVQHRHHRLNSQLQMRLYLLSNPGKIRARE